VYAVLDGRLERSLEVLNVSGTLVETGRFCHVGQRTRAITDHARLQSLQCVSNFYAVNYLKTD
jgi:hypothetical protein